MITHYYYNHIGVVCLFICMGLMLVNAFPSPQDSSTNEDTGVLNNTSTAELTTESESEISEEPEDSSGVLDKEFPQLTNTSLTEDEGNYVTSNSTFGNTTNHFRNKRPDNLLPGKANSNETDTQGEDVPEGLPQLPAEEDDDKEDTFPPVDYEYYELGTDSFNADGPPKQLGLITAYGHTLRVLSEKRGLKTRICQDLSDDDDRLLSEECLIIEKPDDSTKNQEKVVVSEKLLKEGIFLCQEVVNNLDGPLQEYCISDRGWVFHQRPVKKVNSHVFRSY